MNNPEAIDNQGTEKSGGSKAAQVILQKGNQILQKIEKKRELLDLLIGQQVGLESHQDQMAKLTPQQAKHFYGSSREPSEMKSTEWMMEINNISVELQDIVNQLQSSGKIESKAIWPRTNLLNPALLAAFKSDQLESMCEKVGNEPENPKEQLATVMGLADFPEKLQDEKGIEHLKEEALKDLTKAIEYKREKHFNNIIDKMLQKDQHLDRTQRDLIEEKQRFKAQQKRDAQDRIQFVRHGQPCEIDLEEEDKREIRNEIFQVMFS